MNKKYLLQLFMVCMVVMAFTVTPLFSYSLTNHDIITIKAAALYNACVAESKKQVLHKRSGLRNKLDVERVRKANRYEDRLDRKLKIWHFYQSHKDKDLRGSYKFRGRNVRPGTYHLYPRYAALAKAIQKLTLVYKKTSSPSEKRKIKRKIYWKMGHLVHYIQDVTVPSHVVPVFHPYVPGKRAGRDKQGLPVFTGRHRDPFDGYSRGWERIKNGPNTSYRDRTRKGKRVRFNYQTHCRFLEGQDTSFDSILKETASLTIRSVRTPINGTLLWKGSASQGRGVHGTFLNDDGGEFRPADPASWQLFWDDSNPKGFGEYGECPVFGKRKGGKKICRLKRKRFDAFALERHRDAINATMRIYYLVERMLFA